MTVGMGEDMGCTSCCGVSKPYKASPLLLLTLCTLPSGRGQGLHRDGAV